AGLAGVAAPVRLAPGATGTVRLGRIRYRALVAGTVGSRPVTTLGVVSPQRAIDAANRDAVFRLLLGMVVSLVVVSIIAYGERRLRRRAGGRRRRGRPDRGVRTRPRSHRRPAHGRPGRLRPAHPVRRGVQRRGSDDGGVARIPGRRGARQRAAAPDRRKTGP